MDSRLRGNDDGELGARNGTTESNGNDDGVGWNGGNDGADTYHSIVTPAKAGVHWRESYVWFPKLTVDLYPQPKQSLETQWIPAFAGMTTES
jgi:hypothetical protein